MGCQKREEMRKGGAPKGAAKQWIQNAVSPSTKGDLHRALHVAQGEKIPEAKLASAVNSDNPHMRHMAQFAKNVRK